MLPLEVLEGIVTAAGGDNRIKRWTLSRYALICKTWLPVARRLLYQEITVVESDQALLLYASIRDRAELGALIRVLNTSESFHGHPGSGLLRILDFTPLVCNLTLDIAQIPDVQNHPTWHQISRLRVFDDYDHVLQPEDVTYPFRLKILTFEGENTLLNCDKDWTLLTLPEVETLIFNESRIYLGEYESAPMLPKMPKLRCIKILNPRSPFADRLGAADLTDNLGPFKKLIHEAASCLRRLDIDLSYDWPGDMLTAAVLSPLKRLESLRYKGRIQDREADLARTLPSSLQILTLVYIGNPSLDTAAKLMAAFAKPAFLPRLTRCPSVSLLYGTRGELSESKSQSSLILKLARSAAVALSKRSGMLRAEGLALIREYPPEYTLPLLPPISQYT